MSNQPNPPDPNMQGYQQPPNQPPYEQQTYADANNSVRSVSGAGTHAESQYQSYVDPAGNRIESHQEVYQDENLRRSNIRHWIKNVTYFVLAVVEILLLLRLFFRLLAANESSGFVSFLYSLTHLFVGPFNGIFNDQALGRNVFETSTLIAMIIYALLAWGIVSLGRLVFAPTMPGSQSVTTSRRSRYQ